LGHIPAHLLLLKVFEELQPELRSGESHKEYQHKVLPDPKIICQGEIVKLLTFIIMMTSGQASLIVGLLKTTNEFYRASFISAALSKGVYDNFIEGKASFEHICEKMNVSNRDGLRAWLELGVSLGELKREGDEYQ